LAVVWLPAVPHLKLKNGWATTRPFCCATKPPWKESGAVAQGLSAINTYVGENAPEDYVRMVRNDLMGLVREDLIFDLGCHVDDSVHLFEEWGLPVWKKPKTAKTWTVKKARRWDPEVRRPTGPHR
jgi:adenylylsulfate reductase subunit A